MHILIVIIGGFAALARFISANRFAGLNPAAGAALFIWVWLAASVLNGFVGVYKAAFRSSTRLGVHSDLRHPGRRRMYLAYAMARRAET